MYSRSNIPKEPYHIPENYRGNAFHSGSTTPEIPVAPPLAPDPIPKEDISQATPSQESAPNEPAAESAPLPKEENVPVSAPSKKETPTFLSTLLPPKPKGFGGGGILGDVGAEDLLIIGIILLLSQNESDDDVLLLLLLLLFYK